MLDHSDFRLSMHSVAWLVIGWFFISERFSSSLNDYSFDISILRIITSDVLFRFFLSIESDLDISQYIVFKVHVPHKKSYIQSKLFYFHCPFSFLLGEWRWRDSNSWPPACKAGALPTELHPHERNFIRFFPTGAGLSFQSLDLIKNPMGLSRPYLL